MLFNVLSILCLWEEFFMFFEYFIYWGSFRGIFLQAIFDKITKALLKRTCFRELRWRIFKNWKDHLHCWFIGIRGLSHGKLDCCNTDGPDVSWIIMPCLFHYFWSHPTRRAYKSLSLLIFFKWSRDTEITNINFSFHIKQNISSFNISVNLLIVMEVVQTLQSFFEYSGDDSFICNSIREVESKYVKTRTRW